MIADSQPVPAPARASARGGSGGRDDPSLAARAHRLAGLKRAGGKNQRRIASALRTFLQAPAPVPKAVGPGAADPLLDVRFDGVAGRASSRADGYDRQIRQLREAQANPHLLAERFAHAAAALTSVAPHVSLAMQAKAKTGIDFLLQQVPSGLENWAAGTPPGQPAPQPSDAELARWGRYVSAVQDPLSALEGLAQGRVPAEAAETLRTVFPALYGEMQRQLFRALTEHLAGGKTLSVPQRRALSRFLGAQVDRLTAPEFGQALQQTFAQERAQGRQPPPPRASPPRGGRGGRQLMTYQTPTQRTENR